MSAAAQSIRLAGAGLVILVASGCASLPTGSDYPKVASSALTHPEQTTLGRQFEGAVHRRAILKWTYVSKYLILDPANA